MLSRFAAMSLNRDPPSAAGRVPVRQASQGVSMAVMSDGEPNLERWAQVARNTCKAFAGLWVFGALVATIAVVMFDADYDAAIWRVLATTFEIGAVVAGGLWLVGEMRRGYRTKS